MSSPSAPPSANDLLDVAQSVANTAKRAQGNHDPAVVEAWARAAVSRYYFAAYIRARDYVVTNGTTINENAGDHGLVRNALRASTNRAARNAGKELGKLRTLRNDADYVFASQRLKNWIGDLDIAKAHADAVFGLP